jgi:tripartite-type tricarboxylate transporter receptor subunit TctC
MKLAKPLAPLLRMLVSVMLAAVLCGPAAGQGWPSRPLRIVVPYAPGGASDVVARNVGQALSEALGQPVVVENRPGGGGLVGTEVVASAAPDGHTLLLYVENNTIFPSTVKELRHDPVTSFAPITVLVRGSNVLAATPALPVKNLQELVQYAKQHPNALSYASPGAGTSQHLAFEIIRNAEKLDVVHIPYKGGGQAIIDLVGGKVELGMLGIAPTLPQLKAGRIKALAVTGRTRSRLLPDVPTVAESGFPGFEAEQWLGLVAPAKTPAPIVARLHDELVRIMAQKPMVERMAALGMEPATNPTPEDFARLISGELKRWSVAAKAAGLQPE